MSTRWTGPRSESHRDSGVVGLGIQFARSSTPPPESDLEEGEYQEEAFSRSSAPSPESAYAEATAYPTPAKAKANRTAPALIDTSAEEKIEYIPFNVRHYEDTNDPLMFTLDYTEKSHGYPTIRRMFTHSLCSVPR